jgi:CHC2 zinc finger
MTSTPSKLDIESQKEAALLRTAPLQENEMLSHTSRSYLTTAAARYRDLAGSSDPRMRRLARSQIARLEAAGRRRRAAVTWNGINNSPVTALFREQGNELFVRADGRLECGHQPFHGSRSQRCVLVDPAAGIWYCRSCRRGGSAVTFVMELKGSSARAAMLWLSERFGVPTHSAGEQRVPRRRIATVTVTP